MRQDIRTTILWTLFVVITLGVFGWAMGTGDVLVRAEEAKSAGSSPHPVADDTHHFMEYVFEPNYK
jgi:hypothetical protein